VDGTQDADRLEAFTTFVATTQRRVWLPLCVEVGADTADDAVAHALAYAWQHWDRVATMANPAGYVYRTAQRQARRQRRHRTVDLPRPDDDHQPDFDPRLVDALARLTDHQRVAVFVVHGCGWTLREAAELLDVSISTLRNHLARGMAHLRTLMEADVNA